MKVVVIGLGRFGKTLARELQLAGAEVMAMDSDPKNLEEIKDDVSLAVRIDSTDEEALSDQGVSGADAAVVAVGGDFETAVLTTAVLKKLGVPRVLARATSPLRARILKLVGADDTLAPEEEAALQLSQKILRPTLVDYLKLTTAQSMVEVKVPRAFDGRTLQELDLRNRHRVTVVAIKQQRPTGNAKRPYEEVLVDVPAGTDRVRTGDVLLVLGRDSDLHDLLKETQGSD